MLVSRRIRGCNNTYNSKTLVLGLCYALAILVGYHPLVAFATPPNTNLRNSVPNRNDEGGIMWAGGEDTGTKSIIIDVEDPQSPRADTGTGGGWNWSSTLQLTELEQKDRREPSAGPNTLPPATLAPSNTNFFTTPAMPMFSAIHRRKRTGGHTPRKIKPTSSTSNYAQSPVSSSSLLAVVARQQKRKRFLTSGFLVLSGMAESICFRKFGLYPTMMTGNTIKCMTALSDFQWTTAGSIGIYILCYFLGGTVYRFLDLWAAQLQQQKSVASVKDRPPSSSTLSSSSARNLPRVARLALVLFVCADVMAYKMQKGIAALPVMSLTYGLINAAALEEVGCATNAVTGHCTTLGLGFAEHVLFTSWPFTSNNTKSRSNDLSTVANKNSKEKFLTSVQGTSAFVVSVFVTGLAYRWVVAQGPRIAGLLPPLGTSFGLAYLALMTWYVQQ